VAFIEDMAGGNNIAARIFFQYAHHMNTTALMIHGGAGPVHEPEKYQPSLDRIIREGYAILQGGGSALDAVTHSVTLLENDPLFNAGKGSVLTHEGTVEMDASIMRGEDLGLGAVACVSNIKNPIILARAVMEKSPHVFMLGKGAETFAATQNIEIASLEYFLTDERAKQLTEAKQKDVIVLDHTNTPAEQKLGTVGAVARDAAGNLAAATSTGGMVNKRFNRIGDSAVVGSGVFADNETCAVSSTGYGEHFLRTTLAKRVADYIEYKNVNAQQAADMVIAYLVERINGLGGVIVIDQNGYCGKGHSTPKMLGAQADTSGIFVF
jgi:beta-aspartyl-peptidase (threonine type)